MRFKRFGWKYHCRTVSDTTQRSHHHAEAVIHRYRYAQYVLLAKVHGAGGEASVVQNVEMGQSRTFRGAGGSGSELDIDRIIRGQAF